MYIGAHCTRAAGEPEPHVFGPLELEPLERKKTAWAAPKKTRDPEPHNICGSCTGSEKLKSTRKWYICNSSLGKIVSFCFMVKQTIILLVLYFLQFYIILWGEIFFVKFNQYFLAPFGPLELEPVPLRKKNTRSRSRLDKQSFKKEKLLFIMHRY